MPDAVPVAYVPVLSGSEERHSPLSFLGRHQQWCATRCFTRTSPCPIVAKSTLLCQADYTVAAVFGRWPYGFYALLRLVVSGCSIYLAVKANSTRNVAWVWVFGGMAVVFNPLLPLHFHRSNRRVVDLFAATILVVFAARYKPSALSKV